MLVLMAFALIAGAGTAVTPCVLPVLPALLSASAVGGRRRPLGIVIGLAVTFTIAIVVLAQLVKGVGLASGAARAVAITVLIAFGIVMLVPELASRIQAPLSRLARFGPRTRGEGFWSGLGVGGALGFVCAPCAGPILAAVTSVSASSGASLRILAVALAYSAGLSAVLLLYAAGGRVVIDRIKRRARGHVVERALGVVLLLTGVLMAANLDIRFEEALARSHSLPSFLVDPTRGLENSSSVQSRLASLRPKSRFAQHQAEASLTPVPPDPASIPGVATPPLSTLGPAPDFVETQRWFNTPGGRPLSLRRLRGAVVLVDFWTYTCINCLRTLPFLKALYATYHPYGLEIVGVETPEFTFEQDAGNVEQAVRADGIRYPVVQDNLYGTWDAYQNQYWPAEYLVDPAGNVRHVNFGEGQYRQTEAAVRELLYRAGVHNLPAPISGTAASSAAAGVSTPETYLNSKRSQGFLPPLGHGVGSYPGLPNPALNQFGLKGTWNVTSQAATAVAPGDSISARVQAARIYLVMTSSGNVPRRVRVLLDGRPVGAGTAGADANSGVVTVSAQRLYSLVSLPAAGQHTITVLVSPGVSAYDFTFG